MNALHTTYIFPIAVSGVALLMAFGIENKNIKYIGKERDQEPTKG